MEEYEKSKPITEEDVFGTDNSRFDAHAGSKARRLIESRNYNNISAFEEVKADGPLGKSMPKPGPASYGRGRIK